MAPSTIHHQGTLPGSINSSPASHSLESNNPSKAHSPLETSILQSTSIEQPCQRPQFPAEAHLSYRSAWRKGSTAPFLLEKIRSFREGNEQGLPSTGVIRRVRQKDYDQLYELLENEPELKRFAFRRLRLVYDSNRRKLSYDMPGPIHEAVVQGVTDLINYQLQDIRKSWLLPDIDGVHQQNLAEQIRCRGSNRIQPRGSKDQTDPDTNWIFTGGNVDRSCFIFEVANSQNYYDIKEKCRTTISKNRGRPGMALIISISYNEPNATKFNKATYFTIQAFRDVPQKDGSMKRMVDGVLERTLIRDSSGKEQEGSISFTIQDMLGLKNEHVYEKKRASEDATVASYTAQILDTKIELSYADIAECVAGGEKSAADELIRAENSDSEDVKVNRSGNNSQKGSSDSWGSSDSEKQEDPDDGTYKPSKNQEHDAAGPKRRSQRLVDKETTPTLGKHERSESD